PLADREPQTRAHRIDRADAGPRLQLMKRIEDGAEVPWRDPDPGVANLETRPTRAVRDGQYDLAATGELHGVGEEIDQHLAQLGLVRQNVPRHARAVLEPEREALVGGTRLEGFREPRGEPSQRTRSGSQHHLARL